VRIAGICELVLETDEVEKLASFYRELGLDSGAGKITRALVRRLRERGGEVICETPIERIEVRGRRADAAVAADGRRFPTRRAVLADCGAPALFLKMLPPEVVPERVRADLRNYQPQPRRRRDQRRHRPALPAGDLPSFPGLGRPTTPVQDLYLASSSAHPGGGLHGGPGDNAARTALRTERLRSLLRR